MAGRGRGKKGISYVQNDTPSFIRAFKEKIGHKEGPDVDTKRQQMPNFDEDDDEDRPELDEEKPVVVALKAGDLTAAEAEKALTEEEKRIKQEQEEKAIREGKIVFKKPEKRSTDNDQSSELSITSSKRKKDSDKERKNVKSDRKKVKNSTLLSFDEDEEDDDT